MNPQPINIAIIQAPLVWADKQANLKYFSSELLKFVKPVDLVVLPEMFATGFITDPVEISETMEGTVINWMKETAHAIDSVITGSIAVKDGTSFYNRLIWMRPNGTFEQYDKRHLFRMGDEHHHFSQGDKPLTVELKGWKIRPLICYDLRFPVWSKNRFIDNTYEYDLLIYVANWPAQRHHAWQTLLSARAIENQAYCIGVNRIGVDGKGIHYTGGSVILDPKGKPTASCDDNEAETVIHTIEYGPLEHFRENFKVGLDWDAFEIK